MLCAEAEEHGLAASVVKRSRLLDCHQYLVSSSINKLRFVGTLQQRNRFTMFIDELPLKVGDSADEPVVDAVSLAQCCDERPNNARVVVVLPDHRHECGEAINGCASGGTVQRSADLPDHLVGFLPPSPSSLQQEEFVGWWTVSVGRPGGDRKSKKHSRRTALMLCSEAEDLTQITHQQVSKWAKRLLKRSAPSPVPC
jgi:hypothetical protein